MTISRRSLLAGSLATAVFSATKSHSQTWPARPIKMVVPYTAGGPTDFVGRLFAGPMASEIGQRIYIENQLGAGGVLGTKSVAASPADGYTLLHTTIPTLCLNPLLYASSNVASYNDFVCIGTTAQVPNVLVVQPKQFDVSSVQELVEAARKRPNQITHGSAGYGSSSFILGKLLQKAAKIESETISYSGGAAALTDVIAGHIDFVFDNITNSGELIRAGTIRPLAVTSRIRSSLLPDIPTMTELGFPGFDVDFGYVLLARAATPKDIVSSLQAAFVKATAAPEYSVALKARGAEPLLVPTADVERYLTSANERWLQVANELELKKA